MFYFKDNYFALGLQICVPDESHGTFPIWTAFVLLLYKVCSVLHVLLFGKGLVYLLPLATAFEPINVNIGRSHARPRLLDIRSAGH